MISKITKQSLVIAIIGTAIDQIYHIARSYPHQIFDITNQETMYYIGLKFLIIIAVSWFALNRLKQKAIAMSAIIGISSAFIFSVVVNYMYPNVYDISIHMLHAVGIAIGVYLTLTYKLEEKW